MTVEKVLDEVTSTCADGLLPAAITRLEFWRVIQAALELRMPKKPLADEKYKTFGICPTCGVHFLEKSTKHCGNCGQAIDWGNHDEPH